MLIAETKRQSRKKSVSSSSKPHRTASTNSDHSNQNQSINSGNMFEANSSNNQTENSTTLIVLDDQETPIIGTEYINQEILNLRKEQAELDEQGDYLEKELRKLMRNSSSSSNSKSTKSDNMKQMEDKLLREWFLLINRKNALLHRQQELEIL
jgi:hypothetical protein